MVWRQEDPQGDESGKIKWELVQYTRGRVLDVGCGQHKPFPHFIGVDNNKDAQLFGIVCKPDLVMDCENLDLIKDGSMDAVYSSHTLEHVEKPKDVLKEWWRCVKVGGYLVLYLPHKDFYPNIGQPGANKDHKWDFVPDDVVKLMEWASYDLVKNETRSEGREYSFFQVYKKLQGTKKVNSYTKARPAKSVGIVRYGAYGDLIQASSVFKGFKDQGYHVTLHTSPPGHEVVSNDPNIDEIVLQDKDQVLNHELSQFWAHLATKYNKFVQLSECVEGSLLALPGRTPHGWSPLARHHYCDINYLENQHRMAGLAHKPQVRFYPTGAELDKAKKDRRTMGRFVVMWALAGSGVHKTWPYVDTVIANLMLSYQDVHIVLVGDAFCVLLEAGWDKEKRVHCRSARMTIRETLALLQEVDAVVGPETGVLNAASCLFIPKIVFLSHSTHENLTRDWTNVYPLSAESHSCKGRGNNEAPACHQLHYDWSHCDRVTEGPAQGVATCQAEIKAESVIEILHKLIDEKLMKRAA
jgi:ADP-heptose:LPS heptosyltransferase